MRLYYIRHAQSTNNALWERTSSTVGRSDDPELSILGKQQAEYLAGYIPSQNGEFAFTHIYCSLMIRSIQTALPLANALHIKLKAWEAIHESGGIFLDDENGIRIGQPGLSTEKIQKRFPDLNLPEGKAERYRNGWWNRPFETNEECKQRAHYFRDELLNRHANTEDHVAIISHGSFYESVINAMGELNGGTTVVDSSLKNTGITRFDFINGHPNLVYANRVDHLPKEMIS